MTENDTCDTFKSRNDSTITLVLCKGELKMTQKYIKTFTVLYTMEAEYQQGKGFQTEVY